MAAKTSNARHQTLLIPYEGANENMPPDNSTVCDPLPDAARVDLIYSPAQHVTTRTAFSSKFVEQEGIATKSVPGFRRSTCDQWRDRSWTDLCDGHEQSAAELSPSEGEHDAEEICGGDEFQELSVSFLDLGQMYYGGAYTVGDTGFVPVVEEGVEDLDLKIQCSYSNNLNLLLDGNEKQSPGRVFNVEPTGAESPTASAHFNELVVKNESVSEFSSMLGSEEHLECPDLLQQEHFLGCANIFGDSFAVETNLAHCDTDAYFHRTHNDPLLPSFEVFDEHALGAF